MNFGNSTINMIVNLVITAIFTVLAIVMFIRWYKWKGKVMITDQQWSTVRIIFLALGLASFISLLVSNQYTTGFDYLRITATVLAVSAYMTVRDGVGEEGLISGGKFYPWSEVRAYDTEEKKNVLAVYFTVESQDENKPDEYVTKELDFANEDKEAVLKFLKLNLGRKFTRMKRR